MTESATIRIDFTPCRGVPFYPHDTRTMRLMQVIGLHKGVLMTTFPKCAPTSCQGPVSAETPRVHARIPPGSLTHARLNRSPRTNTPTPRASESNGLETHR